MVPTTGDIVVRSGLCRNEDAPVQLIWLRRATASGALVAKLTALGVLQLEEAQKGRARRSECVCIRGHSQCV